MLILVSVIHSTFIRGYSSLFHVDPQEVKNVRTYIPLYDQRRFDIYDDISESVEFGKDGIGAKKS